LLVRATARRLAGDGYQRRAVQLSVGDAGNQVGCAWTEGCKANARVGAQAAVHIGHEGGALLMTGRDEGDLGAVRQRVHEVEVFLARNAEDVADALVFEAADHQVGRLHVLFSAQVSKKPTNL